MTEISFSLMQMRGLFSTRSFFFLSMQVRIAMRWFLLTILRTRILYSYVSETYD